MAIKSFQRHSPEDSYKSEDLIRVQDNIEQHARSVNKCPIIDGVLATDAEGSKTITVPASKTIVFVRHQLGRNPQGWMITRTSAVPGSGSGTISPILEISPEDYKNGSHDRTVELGLYTVGKTVNIGVWVF